MRRQVSSVCMTRQASCPGISRRFQTAVNSFMSLISGGRIFWEGRVYQLELSIADDVAQDGEIQLLTGRWWIVQVIFNKSLPPYPTNGSWWIVQVLPSEMAPHSFERIPPTVVGG